MAECPLLAQSGHAELRRTCPIALILTIDEQGGHTVGAYRRYSNRSFPTIELQTLYLQRGSPAVPRTKSAVFIRNQYREFSVAFLRRLAQSLFSARVPIAPNSRPFEFSMLYPIRQIRDV